MTWQDIPGWSVDIVPFYEWLAKELPPNARHAEIGVFLGRAAGCLGTIRPDVDLWLVDPWLTGTLPGYDGTGEHTDVVNQRGGLFNAFLSLMLEHCPEVLHRSHVIRAKSEDIELPKGFDSVFIDGSHDYEHVMKDIAHARRILKPGGIVCGHDYCGPFNDVMIAVDEVFGHENVNLMPWPPEETASKPLPEEHPPGWYPDHSSCWWVRR